MSDSQPKILRVGLLSEIHGLDPRKAQDIETMFVLRQILDAPFLERADAQEPEPLLFEGPLETVEEGGRTVLRGSVRKDLRFADGAPLTVQTLMQWLSSAAVVREQADLRQDGDSILFTLRRPNARFDIVLSHIECSPMRQGSGGEIYGTGPFYLTRESTSKHLRLVRNPHCTRPVALDEIHFLYLPADQQGKATRLRQALEAGEVDLCTVLPRDEVSLLKGVRKSFLPGFSTAVLYFNTEAPGLADKRVRQALAQGIDRQAVAQVCYENALAFRASSLLPRGMEPVDDGLRYDPEKARGLLAQVGDAAPKKLDLLVIWGPRPYLPQPMAVAELLGRQLGELGIRLEIVPSANSTDFFRGLVEGKQAMVLSGWAADTTDVCDFLEPNLASDRVPNYENLAVSANHGRYRNPEVDELLGEYRGSRKRATLTALFEILSRDVPLMPLVYGSTAAVTSFRVLGFQPSPLTAFRLGGLDLRS